MTFEELDIRTILKKERRHANYALSVEHASTMAVHLDAAKPFEILNRVRPREDPAVKDYRLHSYEPITTATSDKAVSTVQKIMNPKLYEISFPDSAKELEQYLFSNYPFYRNVMTYVHDVLIRQMLSDPNAVAIVMPIDLDITDTQRAQPIIDIAKSSQVWDYEFAKWYLIHRKTETEQKEIENYFHYIDKMQIIYFKTAQQRTTSEIRVEVISIYNHNIGEPPVWSLGGIISKMSYNGALFRSFFSAAVPHWNKAISSDSDLDGAFINHMHPIRVEQTEECMFSLEGNRCMGGKIMNGDREITCPSCSGTGRQSVKSPYGVYLVPKPGIGETPSGIAPVSYVNVPTDATRLLKERVDEQLQKGLEALNMFFEVGANQSGIAKILDRSELYDFLLTLSTMVFDVHIYNIIYYTAHYLYLNKVEGKMPTIQKPTSFDLLTINEDSEILKSAKEAGLDTTYIRIKMTNLIKKDLYGKQNEMNMSTDAILLNPLSGYTPDEVTTLMNAGLLNEQDSIIYANINNFIQMAYAENENFNSLAYEQKRQVMLTMANGLQTESGIPE
jgi:hypothetical protein